MITIALVMNIWVGTIKKARPIGQAFNYLNIKLIQLQLQSQSQPIGRYQSQ